MTMLATAPAAVPCRRRFNDSPCRLKELAWLSPVNKRDVRYTQRKRARLLCRTQLDLKCYCACRWHQRCQLEEAETSVRPRFMGSSRTSHSLHEFIWGAGRKAQ